jgi:hypothetical protein
VFTGVRTFLINSKGRPSRPEQTQKNALDKGKSSSRVRYGPFLETEISWSIAWEGLNPPCSLLPNLAFYKAV